jgi:CTP:molybdopterin cytidylyltransferase MocA
MTSVPAEAAAPFTAIILAAQREGRLDAMAAQAGVTHKCLVPILGRPLLQYVLDALAPVAGLSRIRICIEPDAVGGARAVPGASGELGIPVDFVPSAETITESAYASAGGVDGAIVITTADNVNLTPGAVEALLGRIRAGADAALALARKERVLAAHPEGQRRFYELADGAFSNCNVYAVAGAGVLRMAEAFREGGQFARNPRRLRRIVGLFNMLLFRFRLVSLEQAMKRLSRRVGLRIEAVELEDGAHAVDVDNPRTYRIAEAILRRKQGPAG